MTEYNVHTKPSIKKVAEPLYPHRYKTKAPFGGYGLAGKRHDGESQDAYWPSSIASSTIIDGASVNFTTQAQGESVRFEALDLTSDELKQFGHLYIVSDGVSGCADGTVASRLAVTSVADAYYRALRTQLGKTPPDSYTLEQTLLAAIWAAHYNLRKYDLNLYCYSSKHPKSQTRDFRYGQHKVNDNGDLLCPFCNNRMIALQATMVAVIVRGGWFFAISIGDSRLFQLHNSISQPFGELIPPQASRFLGWRNLQNEHLGRYRGELQNGDHLLLCSDGVIDIYKGQHADRWRQHLTADFQAKDQTLEQLVETNLSGLHNWGNASHNSVFHDDLTIVMCGATSTTAQHTTATSQQTKQAVRSHTLVEREIYKIVNEMGEDRVVQDRLLDLKEVGSQEDDELVEHWRNAYQKYWILKQYFEESAKPELIN
ncbi:MAG: protein phosphatase 2C domain-containing protein, partial [Candidatus Promineifilaceae bacterium]